jgi:hypothetical protein
LVVGGTEQATAHGGRSCRVVSLHIPAIPFSRAAGAQWFNTGLDVFMAVLMALYVVGWVYYIQKARRAP